MANDAYGVPLELGDQVTIPCKLVELQEVTDDGGNNVSVETLYRPPGGSPHRFAVGSNQVEKLVLTRNAPSVNPVRPVKPGPDQPINEPDLPDKPGAGLKPRAGEDKAPDHEPDSGRDAHNHDHDAPEHGRNRRR